MVAPIYTTIHGIYKLNESEFRGLSPEWMTETFLQFYTLFYILKLNDDTLEDMSVVFNY